MVEPEPQPLILASASPTRGRLLRNAGVRFEAVPAAIDETAVKREIVGSGGDPGAIAAALAARKAAAISAAKPGRLVIGADQVLDLDGEAISKPGSREAARSQLRRLSGRAHDQVVCICAMKDDRPLWHHTDRVTLWVRALTDGFMDRYLDEADHAILNHPGAYALEGTGAQLFERIDGDFFTVLGLPLLPVLAFLRAQGMMPS